MHTHVYLCTCTCIHVVFFLLCSLSFCNLWCVMHVIVRVHFVQSAASIVQFRTPFLLCVTYSFSPSSLPFSLLPPCSVWQHSSGERRPQIRSKEILLLSLLHQTHHSPDRLRKCITCQSKPQRRLHSFT